MTTKLEPSDMAIAVLGLPSYSDLHERVKKLEAAIKVITYSDEGVIRNSWHDYVDLAEKAPILREVHNN